MIAPHGFETFSEALGAGAEAFLHLNEELHHKKLSTAVGDEGGFAPALENNRRALELISKAVTSAGYKLGEDISLALDVASSSFFDEEKHLYTFDGKPVDTNGMLKIYT